MSSKKIRNTALRLFTEHGYEGTSLADISEIVGIKKSSIYNHYKSKDDLYIYVYESSCQRTLTIIRELLVDADQKEYPILIRELFDNIIALFPAHYELKFLFRFICYPPQHLNDKVDEILQNYLAAINQLFIEKLMDNPQTVSQQDAELFALHFRLLIYGLYTRYLCRGILPSDEILDYFTNSLTAVCQLKYMHSHVK